MVLSTAIGHVVAAMKWRIFLRSCGVEADLPEALRAHGAGLFANIWLPSLVGGDVLRGGVIVQRGGNVVGVAAGGLVDRVADTGVLLLLATLGMVLTPSSLTGAAPQVLGVAVLALVLGTGCVLLVVGAENRGWLPAQAVALVGRMKAALAAMLERPGPAVTALALSLLVQGSFVLLNAVLGRAVGIEIPLAAWFVAWPLAKLAALLPISLGGLGVREVALAGLLSGIGVDPTLSVAQSLLWQTVIMTVGLIGGLGWLWVRRAVSSAQF
jgi:uncharacterized membrane protein YbhN (UPF0104 family)